MHSCHILHKRTKARTEIHDDLHKHHIGHGILSMQEPEIELIPERKLWAEVLKLYCSDEQYRKTKDFLMVCYLAGLKPSDLEHT
jgi:hypothetical protein